ncbi:MAG TPA: hypothetical protein VF765_26405 [Polyangiaceae bacterium]
MSDGIRAQREAHAQSIATSTIYVPAGGLVFRAGDGTPVAQLSRGPHEAASSSSTIRGERRRFRGATDRAPAMTWIQSPSSAPTVSRPRAATR